MISSNLLQFLRTYITKENPDFDVQNAWLAKLWYHSCKGILNRNTKCMADTNMVLCLLSEAIHNQFDCLYDLMTPNLYRVTSKKLIVSIFPYPQKAEEFGCSSDLPIFHCLYCLDMTKYESRSSISEELSFIISSNARAFVRARGVPL